MNRNLAIHVIEELLKAGISEFVLCPAGRNAPLIELISTSSLKHTICHEERSSAFFALGRARKNNRPVAVIVTSGTAAGELLAAVMEAYYTSVPLVVITADRPRRFRGSNAPQSAEQVGLFGIYAPDAFDLETEEAFSLENWGQRTPLHINVCFEEPEKEEAPCSFDIKQIFYQKALPSGDDRVFYHFFEAVKKPLVIVNTIEDKASVIEFLLRLNAPVYLEGVSCIRHELEHLRVIHPDLSLYDGVLRVGGVPTHRIWRDLEDAKIPVLSITEHPFPGLSQGRFIYTSIGKFLSRVKVPRYEYVHQRKLEEELLQLIKDEPNAEPALIHAISQRIPEHSTVFLGNSLPIRNWDLAASYVLKHNIQASRGLNGIDGQLSCFFGLGGDFAILGDLTALYDFAGMWFHQDKKTGIFIINNGGGKIFKQRYKNPVFQVKHSYCFEHFAKFWKVPYSRFERENPRLDGLIEVVPDEEATLRFWKKWEECLKKAPALCLL